PCLSVTPAAFFLQAEAGIRDFHVTGVQTCALPISCDDMAVCDTSMVVTCPAPGNACESATCDPMWGCNAPAGASCDDTDPCTSRSEERRVGKECTSRRSSEHETAAGVSDRTPSALQ